MPSAVAPLRYRNFRSLWAANILSASGTFIQTVAGSWLMYELTGSSTWVGLMVSSSLLPMFFLSLYAGALADMFDRTKILLIAQSIMGGAAAAMALFTYLDVMTPGLLLGLGLLLGAGLALNIPAWQAMVPDLVPRGLVASAVALQSAAFNAARAVGPAIGGLILVAWGAAAGFGINALTYVVVIVALTVVGRQLAERAPERASMRSAISQGLRYARFTPEFRHLIQLVALFAISSSVVQAVLPVHTVHLGGAEATYGLLLGAMGLGALVGALLRPRILSRMTTSSVPHTITAFGLSGIAVGLAPGVLVAFVAMLLVGFFWLLTLTTLNASAQLMAPEWIRGRAMSLYTLGFAGILPIGSILSGVVADAIGTTGTFIIFSSGAVLLGVLTPRFGVPTLDEIETPEFNIAAGTRHLDRRDLRGGPVIVFNTWEIDEGGLAEFASLMNEIRLIRLTTGAYRWRLLRDVTNPTLVTEFFAVRSWEEHLAQHSRIDDAAAALLERARGHDRGSGPISRHLIAIDVENPPDFDALVAAHAEMHEIDGSIRVDRPIASGTAQVDDS